MKSRREYIFFVVGIIIGVIGGYLFFHNNIDVKGNENKKYEEIKTENFSTPVEDKEKRIFVKIEVENQFAGESVKIKSSTLPEDAWIAVHETIKGELGNILGAQIFPTGESSGEVSLLRRTIPNERYFVAVYIDDGDREFEFKTDDKTVKTPKSEIILVEFYTNPSSPR